MLFHTYEYIFLLLPIAVAGYFLLNRTRRFTLGKIWLVLVSLFFYSWWNWRFLPWLLLSVLVNYLTGRRLLSRQPGSREARLTLTLGILFNVGLLGYFKYTDFFLSNLNWFLPAEVPLLGLVLPLGISFFTFQQIAYLADTARGQTEQESFLNYLLFVSFFPQIVSGPIVRYGELMKQYDDPQRKSVDYRNLSAGLFLFFIGLFKKVIIADSFAVWANFGFSHAASLTLLEGWITSLSYTFQLYFDFSGYTDMAIASALMLNIRLPMNFFSPYRATSIQDFWRRWHMTLSRFLRDYIYIPLGGSRVREPRVYINYLLTFLIGGLWHGAAWTFVFWGFLHGAALGVHRAWKKTGWKLHRVVAWLLTFNFVNAAWVFFRAENFTQARQVLGAMVGANGVKLPESTMGMLGFLTRYQVGFGGFSMEPFLHQAVLFLVIALGLVLLLRNSMQWEEGFRPGWPQALCIVILALTAIFSLTQVSEFIYANF